VSRRRRIASVLATAFLVAATSAETGSLTYPAEDNIRMREGTIEFWMKVPFDVRRRISPTKKYQGLLPIVRLSGEDGALNLHWFTGASYKGTAGLFCSMASKKVKLNGFFMGKFLPKPNTWRHFALTWKDKKFRFYLDGKLRIEKTCIEFIHVSFGPIARHPIFFGDKWNRHGEMALDEVRVSSVARRVEELGCHGKLKPDPFTLILDDFEKPFKPDAKKRTSPSVMFRGEGGLPGKLCEFVEGKYGRGLALYRTGDNGRKAK